MEDLGLLDLFNTEDDIPNPFDVNDEWETQLYTSEADASTYQDQSSHQATEDLEPTAEEIKRSVKAIEEKYPYLAVESIITILYKKLIVQKSAKEQKPDYKVGSLKYVGVRKNWYYEQKLLYFKNFPKMKRKNPKIQQLTHLLLTSVDKNNLLKRVTAKCFMDFGVCYEHIVKQVKILQYPIKPQRRKYPRMMGEVATKAFRELQKFIIEHFQPNIKPSTVKDIQILHPVLLNPFQNFSKEETKVFHDFIRINYDSNAAGTIVNKEAAYNFYKKIYKCKANIKTQGIVDEQLRRKYLKDNQQNLPSASQAVVRIQNGQVIWTRQMQYHLLYFYIQEGKIARAKKVFRKRYNNSDVFSELAVVRRRFFKIMRESVRILQKYVSLYGDKVKAKLDLEEQQTKMLISAPESYNVRVYLSYIYRYEKQQPNFIERAVLEINQFLQEKAKTRLEEVQAKGLIKM